VHGSIEECTRLSPDSDAISVGHYIGVAPQNAELALDRAISPKLGTQKVEGIITALHSRGIIVGELGKHFVIPDPTSGKRVIVIAGMGQPGGFREAELTVLARELVWMLGRMGRQHLYTILIGAGAGNLAIPNAILGWLRGIRRALYQAEAAKQSRLTTITLVERNAGNFILMDRALRAAADTLRKDPEPLDVQYQMPSQGVLNRVEANAQSEAKDDAVRQLKKRLAASDPGRDPEPIRLTVRLLRDTFEFAALTTEAAIPQRDIRMDPVLIDEANDLLPAAADADAQTDRGNLLGRLLLPGDLREIIVKPPTPLVLTLDRSTARIHWEMVALRTSEGATKGFEADRFLGTACGLTRQLRTTFAPVPEPPLLSGRPLRVLIVADPADEAPLPGAQEEGEAVMRIFEQFKKESTRDVEIVSLLGPRQATRVAVLEQLINHRFDILHYAGHCFFDEKDPSHCGWIFSGNHILSADELNRIDRIPRLVFSNACESGITAQQSSRPSALLAPSFAEAFFARGVGDFICTAWPVDDAAALAFSQRVYTGLLGLRGAVEPMHVAIAAARADVARMGPGGLQTWGAYQHYGNPYFRIEGAAEASGSRGSGAVASSRSSKSPATPQRAAKKAGGSGKATDRPRNKNRRK